MISTAVALVATMVTTYFILSWVDNLAMKRAIGKDDRSSYISDMENKLDKANTELDKSMRELKEKLSQELAKEIPKVVANGNDTILVYLLYKRRGAYTIKPSVQITEAQYNLIRRHKDDTKWVDSQLLEPRVARYAMTYYVGVDYSWDDNQGITLHISLERRNSYHGRK
jgi:hypothetical protein